MTSVLAGFTWFDAVLLILIIAAMGVGFAQGILRQVMGLAVLYISLVLGAQYHVPFSDFLRRMLFLENTRLLNSIAFFIIVIFIWLVITWLVADAYRSTKLTMFPLLDQLGGAFLGLVTFVAFMSLALPVVMFMTSEQWTSIENIRTILADGVSRSLLAHQFIILKDLVINSITPWLPYGVPSLFTF